MQSGQDQPRSTSPTAAAAPNRWDSRRQLVTFLLVSAGFVIVGIIIGQIQLAGTDVDSFRVSPPAVATPVGGP